jgi:putative peptidoglycan lipid II flippase
VVDGLSVAALVAGYSGYSFVRGVLFGAGQVLRATVWDAASVVIGLTGVAVALAAGVRGTMLLLPLAASYGAYTVAGWPHGARGRPDAALRRELDVFIVLGVTALMASGGALQLSMVVARVVDTAAAAGHYASALTLATPASMLASSMNLILFPTMAEAWGRGDIAAFRAHTDHAMRVLVLVLVAVFGSLVLAGRVGVDLFFGAEFAQAQRLLPVLLVAVFLVSVTVVPMTAMTTRSQRGMAIYSIGCVAGLLTGVLAWILLAPRTGVSGVALGYLCAAAVIAVVPIVHVARDGQRWSGLLLRAALGAGLVGLLLWLQWSLGPARWWDLAFVPPFVAGWVLLSIGDTRRLLIPLLRGRQPG